jgi:HAE1 family hydrophobic/amphiphilic exporter-1
MFLATLLSLPRLGLDLIPPLSQGEFGFVIELPQGTPLPTTDRIVRDAQAVLEGDTRVERYGSVVGQGASADAVGTQGEHVGTLSVRMAEGTDAADEAAVVGALRASLIEAGATRFRLTRPAVFSLRHPVEVELFAEDKVVLREQAEVVRHAIASIPGVIEARSSAEFGNPEVQVRFDRERMAEYGLSVVDVATVVRGKLQGEVSTRFDEGDREVDIRVRALAPGEARPADVRDLIVGRRGAAAIRLDAVAEVVLTTGPSEIHRVGQSRAAVISADVAGRDMGAVAEDIDRQLAGVSLPTGVTVRLAGQEQEMFRSLRSLMFAMALAGFLVYLVMASQFESLLHPLIVILSLPLGAVGVVWGLLLTGSTVNVVSMVGMVMLAGIVVNNAIVLVDAINRRRAEGQCRLEAIVEAGRDRLRPILMTSATTVLGLVPMAVAMGAGAELRRALAVAVIGGLTVATLLTLLVIPVVYQLLDRKRFTDAAEDA